MTSEKDIRSYVLAVVAAVLAALAVLGTAASAPAAKPPPGFRSRVLPLLELGPQAARKARPPATTSSASLVLKRGVFRPLPAVPGAAVTTHFRNNDRGQFVGAYADLSDGTPRIRGFLMGKNGEVKRLDVPGALATLPLGINDRGQIVGGWVSPGATADPVTGETPTHGFLWDKGRYSKFDVPGSTGTAAYELNNSGQIVGNYVDRDGAQHGYGSPAGR